MNPLLRIEDFRSLATKDGGTYSPDAIVRQSIVDIANRLIERRCIAIRAQTPDEGLTWNASTAEQEGDTHTSFMLPLEAIAE